MESEIAVRELVGGIDRLGLILPISRQAELLGIARQSVYYHPTPVSAKELEIKNQIDVIYTKRPYFGAPRITLELVKLRKEAVNHKRVARYMAEMGLQGVTPKPNLSRSDKAHPTFPYLIKNVVASHPNHIWGTDITYIRMKQGFVYLVAFLDWFSRYILSWQISTTLDIGFVLEAGRSALEEYGNPDFENSDQGSHFTSQQYIDIWNQEKTQISMDGRGRCMDNIFTERLWRTIKYEEVYLKSYVTVREAIANIGEFIEFYNHERPHSSLNDLTPADVYFKERNGS